MNQAQILQKMTGKQRLEQALRLSDLVREIALEGIKDMYPETSKKEQIQKLIERERLDYDRRPA